LRRSGISPAVSDNEAAYIKGWLSKLKSEKRLIVIAAAKAQKAADYILGRSCTEYIRHAGRPRRPRSRCRSSREAAYLFPASRGGGGCHDC
jgi:hypothetical protein